MHNPRPFASADARRLAVWRRPPRRRSRRMATPTPARSSRSRGPEPRPTRCLTCRGERRAPSSTKSWTSCPDSVAPAARCCATWKACRATRPRPSLAGRSTRSRSRWRRAARSCASGFAAAGLPFRPGCWPRSRRRPRRLAWRRSPCNPRSTRRSPGRLRLSRPHWRGPSAIAASRGGRWPGRRSRLRSRSSASLSARHPIRPAN